MKIIVCLDANNGMMFNKRRQSRDRFVIEDILKICNDKKLWMNEYSAEMFNEYFMEKNKDDIANYNIVIDKKFILKALDVEYCFIEDLALGDYNITVDEIVVYRWDKKYPADMYLDIEFKEYICSYREEIKGFSHEKINKEIYILK